MPRLVGRWLWLTALGASTFLLSHAVVELGWERWLAPTVLDRPWFLGSRRALVLTQSVLGVVALAVGLRQSRTSGGRVSDAAALAAGVLLALTGAFAAIGPDSLLRGPASLWPVALLSAGLLVVLPIAAGVLLAAFLRPRR